MRYIYDVPDDDAMAGARLVKPEDAGSLIHDLTGLLERVEGCDFCCLELLSNNIGRWELFKALVRLKSRIEDIMEEAELEGRTY